MPIVDYIPGDPLAPDPALFPGVRDVRAQSASAPIVQAAPMPAAPATQAPVVQEGPQYSAAPGPQDMSSQMLYSMQPAPAPEVLSSQVPTPMMVPQQPAPPAPQASVPAYTGGQYTQYAQLPNAQFPMADPNVPPPVPVAPGPGRGGGPGRTGLDYLTFGGASAFNDAIISMMGGDPSQRGAAAAAGGTAAAQAPGSNIEGFGQMMQITGRPTEAPSVDLNKYTADLAAQIPMVGAAQVRLDPGVAAGVKYQQDALRNLQKLYSGEEEKISDLERDYAQASGQYQLGLQKLSARRGSMDRARNVERGIEAANQAAAEMRFDANRVYSQLAQSPLETGALAIAAGIVQGLQGYAGQDKPNVVLEAVQQAAQRDLANQVEQYKRMQAGQSYTRNAFIEARQQLQDDQQALQVAAMARLDQISKGFSFIRDRLVRAKDRADMDVTIGKLDTAVAEERTKLAVQNADRQLHANIANQNTMQHIFTASARAMADMQKMTAAQRLKAEQHIADFAKTDEGKGIRESLDSATAFYTAINNLVEKGATPKDLRAVIEQDTLTTLRKALLSAKSETGTKGAVYEAFNRTLAEGIAKGSFSPEKREMQQLIAQVFTSYARAQLGKSQTSTELVKALEAFDPQNADSVYRFIGRMVNDADSMVRQQINIMPSSAPVWYNAYGKQIDIAKTVNNNIVNAFQNLQGLQQPDRQGR